MMRAIAFVFIFLAFAPPSNAQVAPGSDQSLPTCANSCVQEQTSGNEVDGCSSLDIKCICSNSSFLDDIACCLAESCSEADQEQAVKYTQQLCGSAGVDVPDKVVCSTIDHSSSSTTSRSSTTSQEPETTAESDSSTITTVDVTTVTTDAIGTFSVEGDQSGSSTDTSTGDETPATAPTESSDTSRDDSEDGGGLSLGAKVGLAYPSLRSS
ncbi:hypothetical protein CC79DRAFT_1151971 [Sarocladium strictum]